MSIIIVTNEHGCSTNVYKQLTSSLSLKGFEYKTYSAAMCKKLSSPPAAIIFPVEASTENDLGALCSSISQNIFDSCPIFTLSHNITKKKLPSILKWRPVIDVEKLPDLILSLQNLIPKAECCQETVFAFGKSIKKDCHLLDISNSNITDISALSELFCLRGLFIQQNNISDISALSSLYDLRMLFAYSNNLTDVSPLRKLNDIGILYLFSNKIKDISALSSLTKLFDLRLSHNNISDISPLSALYNLQTLHLSGNKINSLAKVSSLCGLRELQAADCGLTSVTELKRFTELETLDLSDNKISEISFLFSHEKLAELKLYGNPVPLEQIEFLKTALPKCDILF